MKILALLGMLAAAACTPAPSWIATGEFVLGSQKEAFEQSFSVLLKEDVKREEPVYFHGRLKISPAKFKTLVGDQKDFIFIAREVDRFDYEQAKAAKGIVTVRHAVRDVEKWMNGFRQHAKHGGHDRGYRAWGHAILRDWKDTPVVYVSHFVDNLDAAREFMQGGQLRTAMVRAGVVGGVKIWFRPLNE